MNGRATEILENAVNPTTGALNVADPNRAYGTEVPGNPLAVSMGIGAVYIKVGSPLVIYMSNGTTWVTL